MAVGNYHEYRIKALAEVIFKEIPCPTRDPNGKIEFFDPS
jgi:hypothetical protein